MQSGPGTENILNRRDQCAAEFRALANIVEQAVPLVKSSEALLARFADDTPTTSRDARLGLRLRLSFVNLLGPLKELQCCAEHAAIRDEVSNLLSFYLHMITRSFEVRFSPLVGTDYDIVARNSRATIRCARLLEIRSLVAESVNSFPDDESQVSLPVEPASAPSVFHRPAQRPLVGIALLGALLTALSIFGTIWAHSASSAVTFTCGDLGCQTGKPVLYFLVTAALLVTPALLAAGVTWLVVALGMTRILVTTQLYRRPAVNNGHVGWLSHVAKSAIWVTGTVLTAISMLGISAVSQPSMSPGALCRAGSCAGSLGFVEFTTTLAPAVLLAGLTCLLIAAIGKTLPTTTTLPQPTTRPVNDRTDITVYMRPKDQ